MIKHSVQRDLIKKNLMNRYDHPTADMVYNSIRKEMPTVSLGTVYRNLRFLVDNGDVLSLKLGDGREHFDGHIKPHYHFICDKCGSVEDIFMDELQICDAASKHFSGEIKGHSTYFYGLCHNCKTKN